MKQTAQPFVSLLTIVSLLFSTAPAFAASPDGSGPWADTVVTSSQANTKGGTPVSTVNPARSNPTNALGVAENDLIDSSFFSLGFGGSITLGFDNGISSGVFVVEATGGNYPIETAKVEVSQDGTTWYAAGNISQDGSVGVPSQITCGKYVRVTDTSNPDDFAEATADAYDVDGIQAQGEPCTPPTVTPTPTDTCCNCGCSNGTQTNTTTNTTIVSVTSNTGGNKSNNNNGGTTNVKSGDASTTVKIKNGGSINTNTSSGCCCDQGGNTTITISGNAQGSTNTVNITSGKKTALKELKAPKKK